MDVHKLGRFTRILAASFLLAVTMLTGMSPASAEAEGQALITEIDLPAAIPPVDPGNTADVYIEGAASTPKGDRITFAVQHSEVDPDGLGTYTHAELWVVDTATNATTVHDAGDLARVNPRAISDDGRWVVFMADWSIHLLDTANGSITNLGPGYFGSISPDGTHVAISRDSVVDVVDRASTAVVNRIDTYQGFLTDDGKLMTLDSSEVDLSEFFPDFSPLKVNVYDVTTGEIVDTLRGVPEMCRSRALMCNKLLGEMIWPITVDDPQLWERTRFYASDEYGDAEILITPQGGTNSLMVWDVSAGLTIPLADTLEELMSAATYGETEATVLRLYQAYFNRTPDLGGSKYWLNDVLHQGHSVQQIAGYMSVSDEFNNLYAGTTNAEYVAAVYANVLGRDFDQEGYDYWLGLLDNGDLDRSGVVFWVTQNAEFITNYPFGV